MSGLARNGVCRGFGALVPAIALLVCLSAGIGLARTRALPAPRSATVECSRSAGAGHAPPGATRAGPLRVSERSERSAHYSRAAHRYSSKMPAVVTGRRPITVSVPRRLRHHVRIHYSRAGLATELRMEPCPNRANTFFPGGLVFTRREPIALVVTVAGSERRHLLRLGRFPIR